MQMMIMTGTSSHTTGTGRGHRVVEPLGAPVPPGQSWEGHARVLQALDYTRQEKWA